MWTKDRGTGCVDSFCSVSTCLPVSLFSCHTFPCCTCPVILAVPSAVPLPPWLSPFHHCRAVLTKRVLMTSDYESWGQNSTIPSTSCHFNRWMNRLTFLLTAQLWVASTPCFMTDTREQPGTPAATLHRCLFQIQSEMKKSSIEIATSASDATVCCIGEWTKPSGG